ARRAIKNEERKQIGEFLLRNLSFQTLGHQRGGARGSFLDVVARNRLGLSSLKLQNDSLRRVFDDQSAQHPAVTRDDVVGLIARTNDEAWVEDVRQELVVVVSSVASDFRTDVFAFAVDLMTLPANSSEHFLANIRVTWRLGELLADFRDDSLALGVASVTECSPDRG